MRNPKRGFTMYEIVVAMALILFGAFATLGICVSASSAAAKSEARYFAANRMEDMLNCYKVSLWEENLSYETALNFLERGYSVRAGEEGRIYSYDCGAYTVEAEICPENLFRAAAYWKESGAVLYETVYRVTAVTA